MALVQPRLGLFMQQLPAKQKRPGKRLFEIIIAAPQIKYRPRVVVERRVGEAWKPGVKVVVPITARGRTRSHSVRVWLRASKGQVLRVRLPAPEAAPCYPADVGPPTRPVQ